MLEIRGIDVAYGDVQVLWDVSFEVKQGEIVALLGENGAGKSTLMNVVYGLLSSDGGEVLIDGAPVRIRSPRDAIDLGVGMVHQHFMLVPTLTVAENVILGSEITKGLVLDRAAAERAVHDLSIRTGLAVPANRLVADLDRVLTADDIVSLEASDVLASRVFSNTAID